MLQISTIHHHSTMTNLFYSPYTNFLPLKPITCSQQTL